MLAEYETGDDALLGALRMLLTQGARVSPRELGTTEVLGYDFRLTNARARRIGAPARHWKESLAVGELCWHLSQEDSVAPLAYYVPVWKDFSDDGQRIASSCYGRRIFGEGSASQWERARDVLRGDPASRRAVLTLVDTNSDLVHAKDISCITSIQFIIREGQLNCITTMRSCDVIWGLPYDVYFCTMLQELMAAQLSTPIGWYQHFAGSLHVYDRFLPLAERIVSDDTGVRAEPMPPLTALEALPQFLEAEAALRTNQPHADALVAALPDYWRMLSAPLIRLRNLRWRS